MSRGLQNRKGSTSAELLSSEEGELLLPAGAGAQPAAAEEELKSGSLKGEWGNVLLLVLLYAIQGVPLGLSMGSMPFLMQSRVSYTQIGLFSLASYPYSFKLLWSPVVDSVFSRRFGRRKSWIVPLQLLSALAMLVWSGWVEARLEAGDAAAVTTLFFFLVLLAATQDIAVDGWALTLLSKGNLGYASTCQTVGMNSGYFTSFTIFLALSDPGFCNKHLRSEPAEKGILTLSGYLRFWGWAYLAFTLLLALFKSEGSGPQTRRGIAAEGQSMRSNGRLTRRLLHHSSSSASGGVQEDWGRTNGSARPRRRGPGAAAGENGGGAVLQGGPEAGGDDEVPPLRESYAQLWRVVQLPSVRLLAVVLVTCRLGMLPAEAAAPLKLLEKGATKEALAGLVLVTFPTELVSALVAGRWATSPHPFTPWLAGFRVRLLLAALSTLAVYRFPRGAAYFGDAPAAFATVAALGVATSFTSTLMFTALGSFYNRISDPSMGGAYLTLLNTIANLGITLPKVFIFAAMDWLTVRECRPVGGEGLGGWDPPPAARAACRHGFTAGGGDAVGAVHGACTEAGGACELVADGFYRLSVLAVLLGLGMMLWLQRVLPRLEALPLSAWRSRRPKTSD